jgi:hypothetical protein
MIFPYSTLHILSKNYKHAYAQSVYSSAKMLISIYFIFYSLRLIILFANVDVFRRILVVDISVLAKSNMEGVAYL